VLTGNGGPADSTKVIAFYAYDQAFHYLFFGYGAAISWIITACMLVLIVIYMHWLRTEERRPVKLSRLRRRSRGGER
jgi:ABC-type sugar transport system permease subunit